MRKTEKELLKCNDALNRGGWGIYATNTKRMHFMTGMVASASPMGETASYSMTGGMFPLLACSQPQSRYFGTAYTPHEVLKDWINRQLIHSLTNQIGPLSRPHYDDVKGTQQIATHLLVETRWWSKEIIHMLGRGTRITAQHYQVNWEDGLTKCLTMYLTSGNYRWKGQES